MTGRGGRGDHVSKAVQRYTQRMIDVASRVPVEAIQAFCRRWGVVEFSLFGSVLRDDFQPDSDIDVMVRFEPGERPPGFGFIDMKLELEDLFGRPVDLVEEGTIDNPFRRHAIMRERTVLYAA